MGENPVYFITFSDSCEADVPKENLTDWVIGSY